MNCSRGCSQSNTPYRVSVKNKASALQSAIQFASVRKWPFTSPPASVGAPARNWPLLTGLCDSHRCPNTKSKQLASVRKGPFTSPPAPVGAPARVWPLLTGLCDSHRSPDGASLGPPEMLRISIFLCAWFVYIIDIIPKKRSHGVSAQPDSHARCERISRPA